MKLSVFLLPLILATGAAFAQDIALNPEPTDQVQITKDTFLLRYQKHDFNATANAGIQSTCLIVLPDGRYRFERERQEYNENKPTAHVFEGKVDANELAKLHDIVSNPDFKAIRVIPQGNMIRSDESYSVDILRADGMQRFMITDETRRKLDKTLKPFVDWEHSIEKKKIPENKSAKSNGCQFPRRVQMPPGVEVKDED